MEKENELIKIEITAKEVTKKDGTTFLSFKGLTLKGWYDLRFRKEVENVPEMSCIIYVKRENVNVNRQQKFPVIWIKAIEKVEELKFEQNIADYFG